MASPAIAPMSTEYRITDDLNIHDAFKMIAVRLKSLPGIFENTEQAATHFFEQGVFCIGILKAKQYTPQQMDTILTHFGLDGFRVTVEYVFGVKFHNPQLPDESKVTSRVSIYHKPAFRESIYHKNELGCLGHYLVAQGALDDVKLSPKLARIIKVASPLTTEIPKGQLKAAVTESVLDTVRQHKGIVCVDDIFLDKLAGLLGDAYPKLPAGKSWKNSLFHKFNNAKKLKAAVRVPSLEPPSSNHPGSNGPPEPPSSNHPDSNSPSQPPAHTRHSPAVSAHSLAHRSLVSLLASTSAPR